MNKALSYILMLASVLLAGCTNFGHLSTEGVPAITFDMDMDQTKALISPSNLNTDGSKFIVYDVHTSEKGLDLYLDAQYLAYRDDQWSFTNTSDGTVIQIPWTKKGVHDFFAYNVYDASAAKLSPVEVSYNYSTAKQQSLRVPKEGEWTLDLNSQFDFIYGSASRNVETEGYTSLPINLKHLFSAVSVEVRNASTQQLTLSKLSFRNIKDRGYAEVNYGGNVQYNLSASQSTNPFSAINDDIEVAVGGSTVLYEHLGTGQSFLIWPHSAVNLADVSIDIEYKLGNSTVTKKTISLTENYTVKTWLAGNRYEYLIAVTDNNISFDVIRVVEWINDDIILEE